MSLVVPRPSTVGEFECYGPEQGGRVNASPASPDVAGESQKPDNVPPNDEMDIVIRATFLFIEAKIILRTLPAIVGQFSDSVQPSSRSSARPTPP